MHLAFFGKFLDTIAVISEDVSRPSVGACAREPWQASWRAQDAKKDNGRFHRGFRWTSRILDSCPFAGSSRLLHSAGQNQPRNRYPPLGLMVCGKNVWRDDRLA